MSSTPDHLPLSPDWEYVADRVMGGVSTGAMTRESYKGREATVLRGDVSLENNGGFVQIAFDLNTGGAPFDASAWDGLALTVCGNGEDYDMRLRTDQLSRPWQSFRTAFTAAAQWDTLRIPFDAFTPHKTEARLDPSRLKRIGLLGIGRVFHAELAVAGIGFYRA